jgi:hypothetical protein
MQSSQDVIREAIELIDLDRSERESRAQKKIQEALSEENCRVEHSVTVTSAGVIVPQLRIIANDRNY